MHLMPTGLTIAPINFILSGELRDYTWRRAFGGVMDEELELLAVALRDNRHVRTLDLNYNSCTDRGIAALTGVLQSCVLGKVAADGNPQITQGTRDRLNSMLLSNALAAVHANDPAAIVLDLSEMALRDTHVSLLADALQDNRHVHFLGLWNNLITGAGLHQLMPALRSSAVSAVSIDNCPASTEATALAALQAICVHRTLALLKANSQGYNEVNTAHIWQLRSFDDSSAQALADAMADNTVLERIWVTNAEHPDGGGRSFSDVGAMHLEHVIRNGVSGVVCVNIDFDTADALPAHRIQQIGRACVENALRRVGKNDPALLTLDLRFGQDVVESRSSMCIFGVEEMIRLAAALRGNTKLRGLYIEHNMPHVMIGTLIDVLPYCGIEDATYYAQDEDSIRLQSRLDEQCAANKSRRLAAAASLATHRPFQRLVLGALFADRMHNTQQRPDGLLLPQDLLEVVADSLNKSKTSPFTRAGHQVLAQHQAVFAWHTTIDAASGQKRKRASGASNA